MQEYKILSYVDDLADSYREPTKRIDGLLRNPKDIIRTIEFYTNDEYLSGNKDELGREKPFYNVCNFRVTVAKVGTDIDVKDIKYEPDSLNDSVAAMLINHELYKYLKESNFSKTLNDMGQTRPKYGGLLVKRFEGGGELDIDVVDWVNVDFDPGDVLGGAIIETHYMQPSELAEKADVWNNNDEISEVMKHHNRLNKNKPAKIEIKEVTGQFSESFDPDMDAKEDTGKYKSMCFVMAVVGKKKYLLHKENVKMDDKYKYLSWEEMGKSLGRGVVESGFQSQIWTNSLMITAKNASELYSKIIAKTDSTRVKGNVITGIDHGHVLQLEKGADFNILNMGGSKLPEIQGLIDLWRQQYNNTVSVHDANTGEAPTSGTPYSQTALLNQVANSPFELQREVWGIFLNEILNDWIFPHLVRKILKKHYLVSEFSDEELEIIDEAIQAKNKNKLIKEQLLKGQIPNPMDVENVGNAVTKALKAFGKKREIEIPEKFLDIKGKVTANITGELKNKQAILHSLSTIAADIQKSFNPNTGEFMALKDPTLAKLYGTIIEMSGIPMSFAQLKGLDTKAVSTPDMSAAPLPANPM